MRLSDLLMIDSTVSPNFARVVPKETVTCNVSRSIGTLELLIKESLGCVMKLLFSNIDYYCNELINHFEFIHIREDYSERPAIPHLCQNQNRVNPASG